MNRFVLYLSALLMVFAASCTKLDEGIDIVQTEQKQKTKFDILVTRDGQVVSKERTGIMTKAGVDSGDMNATMDEDIPFGLSSTTVCSWTMHVSTATCRATALISTGIPGATPAR